MTAEHQHDVERPDEVALAGGGVSEPTQRPEVELGYLAGSRVGHAHGVPRGSTDSAVPDVATEGAIRDGNALLAEQLGDPGELELIVLQPPGDLLLVGLELDGPWRRAGSGCRLAEPRESDDLLVGRRRPVGRNS